MSKELEKEMQEFLDKDNLQKEMEDFLKNEEGAKNNEIASEMYPQTIEGKYLQPVYDIAEPVVKGLSIIEKPLSLAIGAGRSIGKGISGQENALGPIKDELSSPFPTKSGSLTADISEAGYGNEPLLDNVLPDIIKQEFPKASSVVESITPNTVADIAVSGVYGSQLPGVSRSALAQSEVKSSDLAKKALIRGSERDIKYVGDLQRSGKLDTLANKVIQDKNIMNNLGNPDRMVEYLQGIKTEVTDNATGIRSKKTLAPGKLDIVGEKLSTAINDIDKKLSSLGQRFDTNSFTDEIVDEVMKESEKIGSGSSFDPEKIKLEVQKYTKSIKPKTLSDIDKNRRPYSDLVTLKRGAADKVFDMKQAGFSNVDNPTFAEQVAQKIWSKADNEINKIADSVGDYNVIKMNNEFSDYQKIRELYANKDIAVKHIPTLIENLLPMGAIGLGAGLTSGSTAVGLLAAGGYPMARSAASSLSENIPSMALGLRQNAINPALRAVSRINPVTASGAMMLPIPMSTERAAQDPEMVYAKILRDFGPQQAELFKTARSVDQVRALFRTLHQQNPGSFEQSKYNSIDGYVDPAFKQQAASDIAKDKGSPAVNADRMERLLHDGYIGE